MRIFLSRFGNFGEIHEYWHIVWSTRPTPAARSLFFNSTRYTRFGRGGRNGERKKSERSREIYNMMVWIFVHIVQATGGSEREKSESKRREKFSCRSFTFLFSQKSRMRLEGKWMIKPNNNFYRFSLSFPRAGRVEGKKVAVATWRSEITFSGFAHTQSPIEMICIDERERCSCCQGDVDVG